MPDDLTAAELAAADAAAAAVDDEKAGLLPHQAARPKGASAVLPNWIPTEDAPAQVFADWLNELYDLKHRDPFVGGERYGTHGDAPLKLVRASGVTVRWTHQSQLDRAASLQAPLKSEAGLRPLKLNGYDVALAGWVIQRLATLRLRLDPGEELVLWWSRYVDARPVKHVDPENEKDWRKALTDWQDAREADEHRRSGDEWRTFIIVAPDGERYVRREDFAQHARSQIKGSLSWSDLNGRVTEAGWQQTRFQRCATVGGAPYVEARCYVVAADWPQGDVAAPAEEETNAS